MTDGTRTGASGEEALEGGAEYGERIGDGGGDVAQEEHHARQQALHEDGGVCAVALARLGGMVGLGRSGRAHQGGDVVGQHLGGHINDQGLLAQARDALEFERVFQALEGLLDTPALVVEIAEQGGREGGAVEVGDRTYSRGTRLAPNSVSASC